jgi:hypothetical protein
VKIALATLLLVLAVFPLRAQEASPDAAAESPSPQAPPISLPFSPPVGVPTRFTETTSEELRVQLPTDTGEPQARSHLTTTVVEGQVSYEKAANGYRRIEVVDSVRRYTEGLLLSDPLAAAMSGLKMTIQLDSAGRFLGVEDAAGYVEQLKARLQKSEPGSAKHPSLTPAAIEAEARKGWLAKFGRYAGTPLHPGVTRYDPVSEEVPDLGKVNYFVASLADAVTPGSKQLKIELSSFAVSLSEGVMDGVPDELGDEFIRWTDETHPPFSAENVRVAGEGEIVMDQNGAGPLSYRLEEDLVVSPAKVKTPLEGEIEASEVTFRRVTHMELHP